MDQKITEIQNTAAKLSAKSEWVPLGDRVLVKAKQSENTLVSVGSDYFIECSRQKALEMLNRQQKRIQEEVIFMEKERELQQELETREIIEEYTSDNAQDDGNESNAQEPFAEISDGNLRENAEKMKPSSQEPCREMDMFDLELLKRMRELELEEEQEMEQETKQLSNAKPLTRNRLVKETIVEREPSEHNSDTSESDWEHQTLGQHISMEYLRKRDQFIKSGIIANSDANLDAEYEK